MRIVRILSNLLRAQYIEMRSQITVKTSWTEASNLINS